MGTVLSTITVPSTVGGVSAGVSAATLKGAYRTVNLAGMVAGDTVDLEGANEDTSAKYAQVRRFSYNGNVAQEITLLPSECSQWYRIKRIQLPSGTYGASRFVTIAGDALADTTNDPLVTDVWTDPVAPATEGLEAAVPTVMTAVTVTSFLAGGVAALLAYPRNVTFITGGATATHAPASAVISGTDINDNVLTETKTGLNGGAATYQCVKAFKTITSVVYAAATGIDATIGIGFGKVFGLSQPVKNRAGTTAATCNVLQEIFGSAGHSGTGITGTFNTVALAPPNGTYAPVADPDAAKDYAVTYERT